MLDKIYLQGVKLPKGLLDQFPIHLARRHRVVPVRFEGGNKPLLIIASENPSNVDFEAIKIDVGRYDLRVVIAIVDNMDVYIEASYSGNIL